MVKLEMFIWFEKGKCDYLSYHYVTDDKEFSNLQLLLQKHMEFFSKIFGEFHVEQFREETYQKGNLAYLYTFYIHAFLTICNLVKRFGSLEQVFTIYQEWLQTSGNTPLFDWFEENENDFNS